MDRLITTGLPQSKVRMNGRDIVMITDRQLKRRYSNIPWSGGGAGGWFVNCEVTQTYKEGRSHFPTKCLAGSMGRLL